MAPPEINPGFNMSEELNSIKEAKVGSWPDVRNPAGLRCKRKASDQTLTSANDSENPDFFLENFDVEKKTRKIMVQESFPNQRFGRPCDSFDKYCDPANPVIVRGEQILDATHRIKPGIIRTPCNYSKMSRTLGLDLYLKKDYLQVTGSFKERGARYALIKLSQEKRARGVISTSAGNHAQALAYHGRDLGIPVTVCMPKIAPLVKVESCREMGAEVILHGDSFDETRDHAMKISAERDLTYINGFDHPDVIAGQGSVGVEILDDVPDVEYIVVPVGGGGLIAGIAKAVKHLKPDVKIIGVESERCPSWQTRQMLGKHTKCVWSQWGAKNTIADGLAVAEVGCNAYATCNDLLEKVISISEDWISIAILRLLEKEKAVTEGGGAAGVAAIIANALPELRGKKVCTVLCGGNIDASTLTRVIDRGLTAEGRIMRFTVNVQDRPGGMVEMLKIVSDCGASVKEVQHDRMLLTAFVYKVALIATVETRGRENAQQLMKAIKDRYEDAVTFHTISACHYGEPTAAMLSQSADPTQETVSEEDLLPPSK